MHLGVCLSVTTLLVASFISTLKLRYEQHYYSFARFFMCGFHKTVSFRHHLLTTTATSTIAVTIHLFFSTTGASKVVRKANSRLDTNWNMSQCKAASYFLFQ